MSDDTNEGMSAAEAKGNRSKVAKVFYDIEGEPDLIRWEFVTGDTVELNVKQVPGDIYHYGAKRGMAEAVRDGYASMGKDVAAAFAKAQERVQGFLAGDWGKTREGGGESLGALWVQALARHKKYLNEDGTENLVLTRTKIKQVLERPDGEKKIEDLKKSPTIKTIVLQIRQERAAAALAKAQAEAATTGDEGEADALALFDAAA